MPKNTSIYRVSLPDDIDLIDTIATILQENGVKESAEDAYDKMKRGEKSSIDSTIKIIKRAVLGEIPPTDLAKKIEEELKFSNPISEKIANGLKEKIISRAKKIEFNKPAETKMVETDLQKETGIKEDQIEVNKVVERPVENPFPKRLKKTETTEKNKTAKPSASRGANSDTYREPIE
ncbi:MAG: hypothetical protein WC845_00840 [Candidatus Staskawiczbacteria bacterium]|jgi:hypothetical protein